MTDKTNEAPERFADTERNKILNQTSTDLEGIVYDYDPEKTSMNNRVWDRLDKMALAIEERCTDLADARVAAAYADAADVYGDSAIPEDNMDYDLVVALTPADAQAALDRMLYEAVEAALKSANGAKRND